MAASNLENQLHSAQKNLLFLQREHANTLKGLHAEIRRLQQHCTGNYINTSSSVAMIIQQAQLCERLHSQVLSFLKPFEILFHNSIQILFDQLHFQKKLGIILYFSNCIKTCKFMPFLSIEISINHHLLFCT